MEENEKGFSAIIMAGGTKKFSFKEFFWYRILDFFIYHEWYLRRGYKCVSRIKRELDGEKKPRPMLEYVLHAVQQVPLINDVIVVGPKKEIEESLEGRLDSIYTKAEIVEQTESFGGNALKGYLNRKIKKRHALFFTGDSPTTTSEAINEFLDLAKELIDEYDIIIPVQTERVLRPFHPLFHRPYLRVRPDVIYPENYIYADELDEKGRVGFRQGNMLLADVSGVSKFKLNEAYLARKLLRNLRKLKEVFGDTIVSRYFHEGITASEIAQNLGEYAGKRIQFVGVESAGLQFDVDSEDDRRNVEKIE